MESRPLLYSPSRTLACIFLNKHHGAHRWDASKLIRPSASDDLAGLQMGANRAHHYLRQPITARDGANGTFVMHTTPGPLNHGRRSGWDVLDRVRAEHPGTQATVSDVVAASDGSPLDSVLARQALINAGVSVEDDPDSLDVHGRASTMSMAPDGDRVDSAELLDTLSEQAEHIAGAPATGEAGAGAERYRAAVEEELAAGSPATLYLREISQARLLTPEEEVTLGRAVRRGADAAHQLAEGAPLEVEDELRRQVEDGKSARRRLIESNLRLVVSIARRYIGRGMPFLDLVQEGNLGLNRGIDKFDPERGYRFSTYVYWWIRQAITRAIADHGRTIRLPVHIIDFLTQVQRTAHELAHGTGHPPTAAEIAEHLNTSEERVAEALRAGQLPVSLESPVGAEQESVLGDLLADKSAQPPGETVAGTMLREYLDGVLADELTARERTVLLLRFGLEDDRVWSLGEIGERLGLSRERVRQIEHEALAKLRRPDVRSKLEGYVE